MSITKLLIVWRHLFQQDVVASGYPFPREAYETQDAAQLEYLTRRSCNTAAFWLSTNSHPRLCHQFNTFSKGTGISEIRFLPGYNCQRVVTVSKGIWSVISCWSLGLDNSTPGITSSVNPRKLAEWCPRSVLLTGFVVNTEADGDGLLAVSLDRGG